MKKILRSKRLRSPVREVYQIHRGFYKLLTYRLEKVLFPPVKPLEGPSLWRKNNLFVLVSLSPVGRHNKGTDRTFFPAWFCFLSKYSMLKIKSENRTNKILSQRWASKCMMSMETKFGSVLGSHYTYGGCSPRTPKLFLALLRSLLRSVD